MYYGLRRSEKDLALSKIDIQREFLETHGIERNGEFIPYGKYTKNAWYNTEAYVAELQNRASSLVTYAAINNLTCLFLTLTLPSEYHPTKTLKNGKVIDNPKFIDDEYHTPKAGTKKLSRMWKRILDLRPLKDLARENRCYFRVTEPHKNGTPHLHVALHVPKESVERVLNSIFAIYSFPQIEISSQYIPDSYNNRFYDKDKKRTIYKRSASDKFGLTTLIKNPFKYLMKYILKTLDDLREDKNNFSNLSLWYIHHSITRFHTSRTLIPLWIYRKINYISRFQNMLDATKDYVAGRIRVSATKRAIDLLSLDENREIKEETIWEKWNDFTAVKQTRKFWKNTKKSWLNAYKIIHPDIIPLQIDNKKFKYNLTTHKLIDLSKKPPIVPAWLSTPVLKEHYQYLLTLADEQLNLVHFGITQNEMIQRGLLKMPLLSLNDYNDDFNFTTKELL